MVKKLLLLLCCLMLFSVTPLMAQEFCSGNCDYDNDVDGSDAACFKTFFGRSFFNRPCPPDGPAPVAQDCRDQSDIISCEYGVPLPDVRFIDNNNGTVKDRLTGLIWMKDANCFGSSYFLDSFGHCESMVAGYCGVTDTSLNHKWRLPNVKEITSLMEYNSPSYGYVIKDGHPFINVLGFCQPYWTTTPKANVHNSDGSHKQYLIVDFETGTVGPHISSDFQLQKGWGDLWEPTCDDWRPFGLEHPSTTANLKYYMSECPGNPICAYVFEMRANVGSNAENADLDLNYTWCVTGGHGDTHFQ